MFSNEQLVDIANRLTYLLFVYFHDNKNQPCARYCTIVFRDASPAAYSTATSCELDEQKMGLILMNVEGLLALERMKSNPVLTNPPWVSLASYVCIP